MLAPCLLVLIQNLRGGIFGERHSHQVERIEVPPRMFAGKSTVWAMKWIRKVTHSVKTTSLVLLLDESARDGHFKCPIRAVGNPLALLLTVP